MPAVPTNSSFLPLFAVSALLFFGRGRCQLILIPGRLLLWVVSAFVPRPAVRKNIKNRFLEVEATTTALTC